MQQNGYRWSKRALYAWFDIKNVPTIPGYDGVSIWKFVDAIKQTSCSKCLSDYIKERHTLVHTIGCK